MATLSPDTLSCDSARLQAIIENGDYDYASLLPGTNESHSIWDALWNSFGRWLRDLFRSTDEAVGTGLSQPVVKYMLIIALILLIAFVVYKVWKKRVLQSGDSDDNGLDYDIVEDNIYGVDFDARISQAVASGSYREAVRLRYLQCLKWLNDNGFIAWQPHKTPVQYQREFANDNLKAMTDVFLPVRYGDYPATEAHFERITSLYREIMKTPVEHGGEGGEP